MKGPEQEKEVEVSDAEVRIELLQPMRVEDLPSTQILASVGFPSFLGAVSSLGVEIRDEEGYDNAFSIRYPDGPDDITETTQQVRGSLTDLTPTYETGWLSNKTPHPRPRALKLVGQGVSSTVYTTDAGRSQDAILGVKGFLELGRASGGGFEVTWRGSDLVRVSIWAVKSGVSKSVVVRYREGQPNDLEFNQALTYYDDPVFDKTKRVFNRFNRLKRNKKLGAPEIEIQNAQRMAQESLTGLLGSLGLDKTVEEITNLVEQLAKSPFPEILIEHLFGEAGRSTSEARSFLMAIREGLSPDVETSELSAQFSVDDDHLTLKSLNNRGNTDNLLEASKEAFSELEGEAGSDFLIRLNEITSAIQEERSNLAALIDSDNVHPAMPE